MSLFSITDTNPNADTGGEGTICGNGEVKSVDCQGPYVIFPAVSTDSGISPHVVLCARHLRELNEKLDAPEPVIEGEAEEILDEDIPEV